MIAVSAGVRVLIATKPVDFRKGADGLIALVREALGEDPFSETIFVFRSKRADRLKIIAWDGSGLVQHSAKAPLCHGVFAEARQKTRLAQMCHVARAASALVGSFLIQDYLAVFITLTANKKKLARYRGFFTLILDRSSCLGAPRLRQWVMSTMPLKRHLSGQ